MAYPISFQMRRAWAVLALAVFLPGCISNPMAGMFGAARSIVGSSSKDITLAGSVRMSAPEGWCFDDDVSQARKGFALMAECARLNGDAVNNDPVMVLVQVVPAGGALPDLSGDEAAALVFSEAGRALLAERGKAEDIRDLELEARSDSLVVNYVDTGIDGGTQIWRGLGVVNGALATVSVRPIEGGALDAARAQALLLQVMNGLGMG